MKNRLLKKALITIELFIMFFTLLFIKNDSFKFGEVTMNEYYGISILNVTKGDEIDGLLGKMDTYVAEVFG